MKNKSMVLRTICVIIIFFIMAFIVLVTFENMNHKIKTLNEETVEKIGFTYLSGLSAETVNHSRTYFSSKFESLAQTLDAGLMLEKSPEQIKEYLTNEITQGANYIALLTDSGEREVLRGDESLHPFDEESFQIAQKNNNNRVMLTINDENQRMIEMVLFRDFSIGEKHYSALLCDIVPETLNSVLNLSYGEEMVYSFVIRKKDSDFIVRNEENERDSYFERITELYEEYEGMQAEDYINDFKSIMSNNEVYQNVFKINDERRILYARPFSYSDWYLVTFMHYNEMEDLVEDNNLKRSEIFNQSFAIIFIAFGIAFISFALYSYHQLKIQRALREKAMLANKSKSEFLSNMSHDIRTPMNVIVGITDIAKSKITDKEKVSECLEKISRSSRHLLSLINDVLDMSQIESGKMTLTPVQLSLCESMENIVAIIQPQIKSKQQKFDIYIKNIIQENVFCDGLRLNQVLINLLSNAVKYTQQEGQIILMLSQENSPKGDDYVRNHIIVKDNGIGMTEEFQKIVFHSFAREDMARVSKEEGTGLGLAITKHIIDVMGGTIAVKSKLNEGSEFHVTVDLKKSNLEEKDIIFDNLNVLVIDDDEELCQSAVHSLKELNANVEYVTSGADAIEKIRTGTHKFDVILVDWQMPHMNGIETVRNIRQHTSTEIPIILMSAYDWGDIEDQAKEAGINGFIAKPLFKSTLFFGINQHMNDSVSEENNNKTIINFNGEKILMAEDNELNTEIAIAILTEAGLEVDAVENGKLCVEKFASTEEGYYAAILMDIRMPVMNGHEATREIRKLDRSDNNIPIIAMTADAFAEDVAKAKECGMNGHVAKPLDVNALFCILKRELTK